MTEQEKMLDFAEEKLDTAKYLIDGEKYNSSISSSYYAAFHAAKALLLEKESSPKTHQGVSSELGKLYRDELSAKTTRNFSQLQTRREEADYSTGKLFGRGKAEDSYQKASKIVQKAKDILS